MDTTTPTTTTNCGAHTDPTHVRYHEMRHTQWLALAAFTTIALVATSSRFDEDIKDEPKEVKWAVSAMSIVLAAAASAWGAHFGAKTAFVGTMIEGGVALLTTGMWAAALPAIMDPDNGLAVTFRTGGIRNPNLYFFSWASLITSFFILFGYVTKCMCPCDESTTRRRGCIAEDSLWMWAGLVFASFVVAVNGARLFETGDCDENDFEVCDRVKYAVGLGAISIVLSLAWPAADRFLPESIATTSMMDAFVIATLLILWTFGITYLTFDEEKSPAMEQGDLYFFTWAGWILLLFMAMKTLQVLTKCEETTPPTQPAVDEKVVDREPEHDVDVDTHVTHDEKHAEIEA